MKEPNKNRPGYAKTKVGWIPNDWKCVHLGEVFEERTRKGKDGLPIYSVTMEHGLVPRSTLDRKMAPNIEAEFSLLVEDGDIAYNMMRMWQGAVAVADTRCVVSPAYVVCRPTARAHPQFMLRYFKSHIGLHQLWAYSHGITGDRLRLYYGDFAKVPAPLPPYAEQSKIADIVSTCESATKRTSDLIAAKKEQKRALMQRLLTGKKRLPGFNQSAKRVSYRFFDLPSDWRCPHVGEVARERNLRNRSGDPITVLTCSKHRGFVESSEYFGKQVFSEDISNYKIVRRGWFAYPSNHVEEGSIGLLRTHDKGVVSPIYTVFEANKEFEPDFLFAVFKTQLFRHVFAVATNASVDRRGSLRWDGFAMIRVPCPTLAEQRAIADVLSAADSEITCLESKLAALEEQMNGLMQQLLTGQLRVKV